MKVKRILIQFGQIEKELRKYAADRNMSINAAVCLAVHRMLKDER